MFNLGGRDYFIKKMINMSTLRGALSSVPQDYKAATYSGFRVQSLEIWGTPHSDTSLKL